MSVISLEGVRYLMKIVNNFVYRIINSNKGIFVGSFDRNEVDLLF